MIYRQGNRFCDRKLAEYHIGSGQNYFLTCIYEHQGINMYELAQLGHFYLGLVKIGIKKVEELGYILLLAYVAYKRIRHLYTTQKAAPILERLYEIRREWNQILTEGLTAEESAQAEQLISKMAENAWKCMNERESD